MDSQKGQHIVMGNGLNEEVDTNRSRISMEKARPPSRCSGGGGGEDS